MRIPKTTLEARGQLDVAERALRRAHMVRLTDPATPRSVRLKNAKQLAKYGLFSGRQIVNIVGLSHRDPGLYAPTNGDHGGKLPPDALLPIARIVSAVRKEKLNKNLIIDAYRKGASVNQIHRYAGVNQVQMHAIIAEQDAEEGGELKRVGRAARYGTWPR